MSLFNFNTEEMLTFFAVLVRISCLVALLPFFGDKVIPAPVKILLSLAISVCLFPALVAQGIVKPGLALVWSQTAPGLIGTVVFEGVIGMALGFTARITFDSIQIGADFIGNLMGLSTANQFDPFYETQTQVIAQFQMAIAMLLFLAIDGHHILLQAMIDSFRLIAIGEATPFSGPMVEQMTSITGEALKVGLQIAAPMVVTSFAINVVYGVLARAMPQLNILVISFSISAVVGFFVMFFSIGQFHEVTSSAFSRLGGHLTDVMRAMGHR